MDDTIYNLVHESWESYQRELREKNRATDPEIRVAKSKADDADRAVEMAQRMLDKAISFRWVAKANLAKALKKIPKGSKT